MAWNLVRIDATSGRAALGTLVNLSSRCMFYRHVQILLSEFDGDANVGIGIQTASPPDIQEALYPTHGTEQVSSLRKRKGKEKVPATKFRGNGQYVQLFPSAHSLRSAAWSHSRF